MTSTSSSPPPPKELSLRVQRWLLLLILLATGLPRLIGIDNDLLGQDEWRETETATIARNFAEDDEPSILFPRINWGEPGQGYVEAEFQLLPFTVQFLYRAFGPQPWFGRALAVALTALSTWVLFRLARRLLPRGPALLAALLFGSAPIVFRFGRAFMPEAAMLLFYLLAAERVLGWLDDRRWRTLLAAAASMAVAILVKPTSIHFGLVVILLVLRRGGLRLLLSPQVLAFGAIALLPAVFYYAHAATLHHTYGNTFGVVSGGDSKWGSWANWSQPGFWFGLARMDVVWTVGYTGAGLAVLAVAVLWRTLIGSWLLVLLLYYAIVARYAGVEGRGLQYHIYAAVPLAVATAAGADWLWRWLHRRWSGMPRVATAAVAMAVALTLVQQWRNNQRHLVRPGNDVFVRAGRALAAVTVPTDRVVVTSTDVATEDGVDNNFEEPKVMFHAWRRGRVLACDRLNAQNLDVALRQVGARHLVVIESALATALPDFKADLQRFEVVAQGDGFRILRLPLGR